MSDKLSSPVLGTQQSPIDIIHEESLFVPALSGQFSVNYLNGTAHGIITGKNFELTPGQGWQCTFRGKPYDLFRIHFHKKCEHTVDGTPAAKFELHLMHTLPDSEDKLVLGVFVDAVSSVDAKPGFVAWSRAISQLADTQKRSLRTEEPIALGEFLPSAAPDFWTYKGSLTSYPFTEDITWLVAVEHVSVNPESIPGLTEVEQDARPLQPLNRRFVLRSFE